MGSPSLFSISTHLFPAPQISFPCFLPMFQSTCVWVANCLAVQVECQAIMGSPSLVPILTDLVPARLVLCTAPQISFSCFSCFLKKMAQIWSTVIRNTGGVSSHKTLPTRLQPQQQVDTTTLVLTKTIWQLLRRIRNFQARSDGDYNNCKKLWHICKTVDELFIIWLLEV